MKKIKFLVFLFVFSSNLFTQEKVFISDKYYGLVYVEDQDEVFSPGWITINEVGTDKELIRVISEELAVDYTPDGKVKINVRELPYGEQSVIIYDDFNFDGVNDFAIEDGQNSCYHGPSFQIYLADNKNGFKHSPGFTELAQAYCGMFDYDADAKVIKTMTKSGCCWHQFNKFEVVNNEPELVNKEEISMTTSGCFYRIDSSEKVNGKIKNSTNFMLTDDPEAFFTFKIAKNEKEVLLFSCLDNLQYVLLAKDGKVEFTYPLIYEIEEKKHPDFIVYKDASNLSDEWIEFSNKDTVYRIYNKQNKVGIKVTIKGKTYDMQGDLSTRKGSISSVYSNSKVSFENVMFEHDR